MSKSLERLLEDRAVALGTYDDKRHKTAFVPFTEQGNPLNFDAIGSYTPASPGIFEITSANVEAVKAAALVIWNIQIYIEQTAGTFRVDNYGHQAGLTNGWILKSYFNGLDDSPFAPAVKTNSEIELGFPNGAGGEIPYAGGGNKVAKYWVDYQYANSPIVLRAGKNDSLQFVHQDAYGVAYVRHTAIGMGYYRYENFKSLV